MSESDGWGVEKRNRWVVSNNFLVVHFFYDDLYNGVEEAVVPLYTQDTMGLMHLASR